MQVQKEEMKIFNKCSANLIDASSRNIRVIAITGGNNVPSRRYRIAALAPFLAKKGVELTELCPVISKYPPSSRLLRLPWFIAVLLERITFIFRSRGYDAVILQREMISTLPTLERLLPKPRVLDVDDAIYLHRKGLAAKYIARSCSLVICGNRHLAEKFYKWNKNVYVIPTAINISQLRPAKMNYVPEKLIIGWVGTAGNYKYLESIEPALRKVLASFPDITLQIISDQFPSFLAHFGDQLDFRLWYPEIENKLLPKFTIGVMPLFDNEWARGKCAYKMLQYMAAGVPVVVSPVGKNKDIIEQHDIGIAAGNTKHWEEALVNLLNNPEKRLRLGLNGRRVIENEYSLDSVAEQWSRIIFELLRK